MTTWTAPDVASLRGDNSRPLQKIFGSLTEYLKHFETTIIDEVISQSSETFVRNGEATTLTIGTVVYLDAQQGDRATVKRAFNTSDATSAKTLGVVAETIAPNADGLVTTLGYVYKCDTSGYTAGQTLYLGSTAGTFTATKPVAPNHMVYVGVVVRANAGNGIIYVRCQNGYELDEIHDVLITSPTAGQILSYDAVSSLWKNTTLIDGSGLTNLNASNLASGTVPTGRMTGSYTGITGVGTLSALRVDGNFGIGVNGLAQIGLRIGKDISGSAFSQGIYAHGTIQPSVTSRSDTVWSNPSVAASVTLPALNHFYASSPAIGTGSTITTVTGYSAEANLGNNYSGTVTNVYAFSGNIASGTGRWNFFANGTANNYMAGRLGIGLAVTSGAMAQVVNTTAADKAFIIRGALTQSGDFFDIQNSAATTQFRVDSNGNLFVASNAITGDAKTKIGLGRSGNGFSYIDLIGDTTYTDYGLRLIRNNNGANAASELQHRGTGNFSLIALEASPIIFSTSNTERMRIDSLGFVGIGTATPFQPAGYGALTIDGSSGSIISGRVAGTETFRIQSTAASTTINNITALPILFNTNNTERMRIDSNGNVGIGSVPTAGRNFTIGKIMTGATQPIGIFSAGQVQSDATNGANYFNTYVNTAASVTTSTLVHYTAQQGPFNGSTVSGQIGFNVQANLIGATNNYGFFGSIPSGTGRWNLYMDGTANNYLAGNLGIGIASPSYPLHISGGTGSVENIAMAVDVAGGNVGDSAGYVMRAANTNELGAIRSYVEGSYLSNMSFFTAGATNVLTERMRIDSAGNVGIGTSSPASYGLLSVGASIGALTTKNMISMYQSAGVDSATMRIAGYAYTGVARTAIDFVQNGATNFNSQMVFSTSAGAGAVERMRINGAGEVGIASPPTSNIRLTVTGGSTNSANPVIMLNGVTGSGALYLHNDMSAGAYNSIVTAGSKGIIATGANNTTTRGALVIAPWSSDVYGIRFTGGSTTDILVRGTTTFTPSLAVNKALIVQGAVSQSASLFEAQNSSGTALVTINSAGKVGIGNTAPENTLDITGSFGRGNPAVKTANFTLAGTENWIICNGAGTISITLPTPSTCDGREFGIKTVSPQLVNSASANVIAIGGGLAGTAILPATAGAWAILVSDGANWNIMCRGT